MNAYFDILEETLEENQLQGKPCQIFNMDETGLALNPPPLKTVQIKGEKNPSQCSSGVKNQVTVVGCVNAGGYVLPPMVIWNRKTLLPELATEEVPGTLYGLCDMHLLQGHCSFYLMVTHRIIVLRPFVVRLSTKLFCSRYHRIPRT